MLRRAAPSSISRRRCSTTRPAGPQNHPRDALRRAAGFLGASLVLAGAFLAVFLLATVAPLLLVCAGIAAAATCRGRVGKHPLAITQPSHSRAMHDLIEIGRIDRGEIEFEEANFEIRGPDGVLVDDPDAVKIAEWEEALSRVPPGRKMRWP